MSFISQHTAAEIERAISSVIGDTGGSNPATGQTSLTSTWTIPLWTGNAGFVTVANLTSHVASGVTASDIGLGNVENVALSTWAGSANLTTLGTVTGGTWNGAVIASAYIGSHAHAASDVTSGTLADARISESSVTQHESALSITESQISDLGTYQAQDAGLTSIAGLTTAADKMLYTTASDTYAVTDLTSFARSILDDADAATVRTTIGVDAAGTDNSTNVSLAAGLDYLSLAGQVLTLGSIDLTTDVTGVLPSGNIGAHNQSASTITAGTFPSGAYVFQGAVSGITTLGAGAITTSGAFTLSVAAATLASFTRTGSSSQARLSIANDTDAFYYGINGSEQWAFSPTADLDTGAVLSIGRTGAVTFTGAVSGITTLASGAHTINSGTTNTALALVSTDVKTAITLADDTTSVPLEFYVIGNLFYMDHGLAVTGAMSATTTISAPRINGSTGTGTLLLYGDSAATIPLTVHDTGNVSINSNAFLWDSVSNILNITSANDIPLRVISTDAQAALRLQDPSGSVDLTYTGSTNVLGIGAVKFSTTGTLASGALTVTGTGTFAGNITANSATARIQANSTGTNPAYDEWTNPAGSVRAGIDRLSGGGLFVGGNSSAYAAVFGHRGAYSTILYTNDTGRYEITSAGNHDFKTGAITTTGIFTSSTGKITNALADTYLSLDNTGTSGDDWWLMSASSSSPYATQSGSFIIRNADTGIKAVEVNTSGNWNFQAGSITTTGTLASGNITTTSPTGTGTLTIKGQAVGDSEAVFNLVGTGNIARVGYDLSDSELKLVYGTFSSNLGIGITSAGLLKAYAGATVTGTLTASIATGSQLFQVSTGNSGSAEVRVQNSLGSWAAYTASNDYVIRDRNAGVNPLVLTSTGATVTGTLGVSGKVSVGTGTANARLHVFDALEARITLEDTGAALNQKAWDIMSLDGTLKIRRMTDVYSGYTSAIEIDTSDNVSVKSYLQGTTANGFLDLRGDSGATSGLRIDDAGNVGIGATTFEAAWSGYSVLKIGSDNSIFGNTATNASAALFISQNLYNDGTNYRYVGASSNEASLIDMRNGTFSFRTAAAGTTGNIATLTTYLSISNTGAVSTTGTLASGALTVTGASILNGAVSGITTLSVTGNSTFKDLKLTNATSSIDVGTSTNATTVLDFDFPDISTATGAIRVFRNTNTSGTRDFTIYKGDGTGTSVFSVSAASSTVATGALTVTGNQSISGSLRVGSSGTPAQKFEVVGTFMQVTTTQGGYYVSNGTSDGYLALSNSTNGLLTGTVADDTVVRASQRLYFGIAGAGKAYLDASLFAVNVNTTVTGTLGVSNAVTITSASDQNAFTVFRGAEQQARIYVDANGAVLGLGDNAVDKITLDGRNGYGSFSSYLQGTTTNGYLQLRGDSGAGSSGITVYDTGGVTMTASTVADSTPAFWIHNGQNAANKWGLVVSTVNNGSDSEVFHVRTNNTTATNGTSLLHVRGDGWSFVDQGASGGGLVIGATATNANAQFYATKNYSNSSGTDIGHYVAYTQNVAHTGTLYASRVNLDSQNATGTVAALVGTFSRVRHTAAGGTLTEARAYTADVHVTNALGTITTAVGLYINPFTATGTITNRWGIYQAGASEKNYFAGSLGIGTTTVTPALLNLGASTTSKASLNIPSGTAPTSPTNGDIWSDGSDLKVRLGGTTYTLTKS